jgi:hypothetical protein
MGPMEYSMVFAQKMLKIRHGGHFDFSDFSDSDGVHGKKPSRTPRKLYKMPPSLYGGDYGGFTTLYIYMLHGGNSIIICKKIQPFSVSYSFFVSLKITTFFAMFVGFLFYRSFFSLLYKLFPMLHGRLDPINSP